MKKRILILTLSIMTLLSVFSGCDQFESVIPVERIEITNKVDDHNDTWGDYVVITEPDEKGEIRYQINYRVYPENATNTNVSFSYQASPDGCATVDKSGAVTFSAVGMIKVFVITTDGGEAQDTITLVSTVAPDPK